MITQIVVRLDERELAALDIEVAEGRAANRSEAVYPEFAGVLDLPHPPPD